MERLSENKGAFAIIYSSYLFGCMHSVIKPKLHLFTSQTSRKKLTMTCFPCGKIYSIRCRAVTLFLSVAFTLFVTLFYGESILKTLYLVPGSQSTSAIYGIMFDAGSTGSRIHVFTFVRTGGRQLKLTKEYFYQVKPGLSAYASDPKQGAHSIEKLLQKSKEIIPKERWESTPVSLKATAGLRMLPSNSSEQLLSEVGRLFTDSPFFLPGQSAVSIMDGPDEGLFAWITVNFLLGGLTRDSSGMFGTLDLGGGSTQITLNPVDPETLRDSPEGFSRHLNIAGRQFTLYTHSYLGLGLMAARTSILQLGNNGRDSNGEDMKLSPCIHSSYSEMWKFGGKSISIGGLSSYGFSACKEQAVRVISDSKVHKPVGIQSIEMYAFSYFSDRAVDMGLIDKEKGGTITVGDFINGATKVCSKKDDSLPYLCLDATYIAVLLKEGYGFTEDRKLTLRMKINDVEISWALGATLDLFEKMT
ncbi:unnamed protein product [Porites lobata]|uniref:Ectonucleoside triphosphate diphosphohydrolase 5 n=1 Tax=Porites lobata TaxID=104759 RepID=A0ABN8NT28_9CNID|nr:unnamed protein product [Porites lobata]